ncbi:MAG: type 4a pilus biogenesis protein PilO [Pseudomonadota bacterium]
MNWEEIRNLDFEDPGGWPPLAKGVAAAAVVVFILVVAYFLKFKDEWQVLKTKEQQEITLRQEFEEKQQKAANLEKYREQLDELRERLSDLIAQLPDKTEMAKLLQEVSQKAIGAGIDVQKFQPQAEILKEVYAEKPIQWEMIGGYHQFGDFVSQIAALPRLVVVMQDVTLEPADPNQGGVGLALSGTVNTYRYLTEEEQAAQLAPPAQGGNRR